MTQQANKASKRQTVEQKRGNEAWKDIQSVKKDMAGDYRSLARGLNAMIQINGLCQTLGFLNAKSVDSKTGKPDPKKAHYQILRHLSDWMRNNFTTSENTIGKDYNGLLFWAINENTGTGDYRRAITECLALGRWLSRFAEAELSESTSLTGSANEGTSNG